MHQSDKYKDEEYHITLKPLESDAELSSPAVVHLYALGEARVSEGTWYLHRGKSKNKPWKKKLDWAQHRGDGFDGEVEVDLRNRAPQFTKLYSRKLQSSNGSS